MQEIALNQQWKLADRKWKRKQQVIRRKRENELDFDSLKQKVEKLSEQCDRIEWLLSDSVERIQDSKKKIQDSEKKIQDLEKKVIDMEAQVVDWADIGVTLRNDYTTRYDPEDVQEYIDEGIREALKEKGSQVLSMIGDIFK